MGERTIPGSRCCRYDLPSTHIFPFIAAAAAGRVEWGDATL